MLENNEDTIDCEECRYLRYESDINTMVCTSKGGCDRNGT